ncbi:WGR domain-containing protein [Rhizobium nepotum]|uniref:WGR domain-containing protein n=1 Tax=Rhizobium nepotum TaxID=1035271 RepID=UPI003CF7FF8E
MIDDPPGMTTQPYQLYIERTDASMNMARYYAMDISETLFGETRLTRRWGRIGVHGQSKAHIFQREEEAVQLFLDLVRQKRTRGYRPAGRQTERGPLVWPRKASYRPRPQSVSKAISISTKNGILIASLRPSFPLRKRWPATLPSARSRRPVDVRNWKNWRMMFTPFDSVSLREAAARNGVLHPKGR